MVASGDTRAAGAGTGDSLGCDGASPSRTPNATAPVTPPKATTAQRPAPLPARRGTRHAGSPSSGPPIGMNPLAPDGRPGGVTRGARAGSDRTRHTAGSGDQ